MTTVRYRSDLHDVDGRLPYAKAAYAKTACTTTAYAELRLLGLWSTVGLTLTGLLFALGHGVEIGRALMVAG
jgi:hypothetical protein